MNNFRTGNYVSLIPLFFLLPFTLKAQNITGIWRGYFITESYEQYKFELQIKQKNNSISGVSYSYLSTVFYGKATLTGIFNRTAKNALIQEIKTVELRMTKGSSACTMKCNFSYIQSGNEEFLEGSFSSFFEKSDTLREVRRGDDCGGGTIYLRKVSSSDFYIEPFLRNYVKNVPSPVQPSKTNTNPPVTIKKPPVTNKNSSLVKQNPNTNKSETNIPPQKIESPEETVTPEIKKVEQTPVTNTTPYVLRSRTNELVRSLTIDVPNVTIKIYDNGEIDDDTVTVYIDKKLVLSKQRLSESPLILKMKMDEDNSEHELVMVADNLGRIPPNTSLMIVEAGEKRYDVRITSTEQKNAVIRFKYQKPK